jgi:putative transposase
MVRDATAACPLPAHRTPTDGDTPETTPASSLDRPAATACQNCWSASRRASVGRPGDHKAPRPDRSERRFRRLIATSAVRVLQRPLESAQYCSAAYQAELRAHGFQISMSGRGNCFDNAMVETFFKTLKSELVWRTVFQTRAEATCAIGAYIDGFYNPVRRHSALGFLSPTQFERRAA